MIPSVVTIFLIGQRIIPFVSSWLTTTKRESKLEEASKLMIRSQEICWKGQEVKDLIGVRSRIVRYVFNLFC